MRGDVSFVGDLYPVAKLRKYNKFNPKRRIAAAETISQPELEELAEEVVYSGNPLHKKSPGDFGLDPPACARPGKTLCDSAGIFRKEEALELLREGLRRGAVSEKFVGKWPKQVWAISDNGDVLEAQRDGDGSYHGYPLAFGDAFRDDVIDFWHEGTSEK